MIILTEKTTERVVSHFLRPLAGIVPTEHTEFDYCLLLAEEIRKEGYWTDPISVEKRTGLIMDGNHRYHVAKRLGLKRVPCFEFCYEDSDVQVFEWGSENKYPKEKIFNVLASQQVLPFKSTRHQFAFAFPKVRIALTGLM